MISMEDSFFASTFDFRLMIVDEAHRLKSSRSKTLHKVRSLTFGGVLLLTGTPLQNRVKELWPLLNLLDPDKFVDEDEFVEEHEVDNSQIGEDENVTVTPLISLLHKVMLRRMKSHVEHRLKPKMETVVEVELTRTQKKYYRALYVGELLLFSSPPLLFLHIHTHIPHTHSHTTGTRTTERVYSRVFEREFIMSRYNFESVAIIHLYFKTWNRLRLSQDFVRACLSFKA